MRGYIYFRIGNLYDVKLYPTQYLEILNYIYSLIKRQNVINLCAKVNFHTRSIGQLLLQHRLLSRVTAHWKPSLCLNWKIKVLITWKFLILFWFTIAMNLSWNVHVHYSSYYRKWYLFVCRWHNMCMYTLVHYKTLNFFKYPWTFHVIVYHSSSTNLAALALILNQLITWFCQIWTDSNINPCPQQKYPIWDIDKIHVLLIMLRQRRSQVIFKWYNTRTVK